MKASLSKVALVMATAAVASCSTLDFSDKYGNGDASGDDRKNLYTQKWIERYGLFDPKHDWTTLTSVDAEITGEYGEDIEARIYNSNPKDGGHLIGLSRKPGRLKLDLPKDATSVYAEISDGKGDTFLAGEFDVALNSVSLSSSWAHAPQQSRSAHAVSYFDAMVVCEDLGGIGDYDFNDVVLGLRHVAGTNTLKIMPMAAGGTLHADVYYGDEHIGEIHELLSPGSDVSSMLNTQSYDKISKMNNVTVPEGFTLSKDWKNIRLVVKDKDNTVIITGPERENEAPQMFCLGGDWFWPKETISVDDAYLGFTAWTTSMLDAAWADAYSDISRVVTWDLTELKPNWFSGVTTDGSTYKALIDGSSKVDVASGEVYALDPPSSLARMFQGGSTLTSLDVAASHFDTSRAADMSNTFDGCSGLTELDLSNWDTGNVTTMQNMFNGCSSLEDLNLSGMNTVNVTNLSLMFNGCASLKNLNISGWDISNVENSSLIFSNCNSLESVTMDRWVSKSETSNLRNMLSILQTTPLNTLVMRDFDFTGTKDLSKGITGIFQGFSNLTTLDVTGWITPDLETLDKAFDDCNSLETITGINTWDVSNITNVANVFHSCSNLKSLDLSNWNTGNVTNMHDMFSGLTSLTDINLSGMNTANVTEMTNMFNGCTSLKNLDISGWDISNVTNSAGIFGNCKSLESVTMNNWVNASETSNLRTMLSILQTTPVNTLVMQNCDFRGTSDLSQGGTGIFQGLSNLTTLDVTGWDTSDLQTINNAFIGCDGLETITGINTWNVSKVTSLSNTFHSCENLKSLDLSNWDTSNVTTMVNMFSGSPKLTDLNLSGMNTAKVTNMAMMFQGCSALKTLDISGWDISNISNVSSIFNDCKGLESLTMNDWVSNSDGSILGEFVYYLKALNTFNKMRTLEMRNFKYTGTNSLLQRNQGIFQGLTILTSIDVTGWNLPNIEKLENSFNSCSNLETIIGIDTWKFPEVTSLNYLFNSCSSLKSLDLGKWDTTKVTSMSSMFNGCKSLEYLDISGWDISNVTTFSSMFTSCLSNITIKCTKATKEKLEANTSAARLPANVQWVIVD